MHEYVDIRLGYILAPGVTMPNYDIYEIDIFGSVEAFRSGDPPLHSAQSTLEAEQWIDKQPIGVVTEADMAEFNQGGSSREEKSTLKVERYGGGIVKVGNVDVMTSVVGGGWTVDYITVTPEEIDEYRGALARAHVNIVKVVRSEGLIVFEE